MVHVRSCRPRLADGTAVVGCGAFPLAWLPAAVGLQTSDAHALTWYRVPSMHTDTVSASTLVTGSANTSRACMTSCAPRAITSRLLPTAIATRDNRRAAPMTPATHAPPITRDHILLRHVTDSNARAPTRGLFVTRSLGAQ